MRAVKTPLPRYRAALSRNYCRARPLFLAVSPLPAGAFCPHCVARRLCTMDECFFSIRNDTSHSQEVPEKETWLCETTILLYHRCLMKHSPQY
jgi:hypothetical protein